MRAFAKDQNLLKIEIIILCALLCSIFAVATHVNELGFDWVNEKQILRHRAVLERSAPDPWQYRILPEYLLEMVIQAFQSLPVAYPIASAFILFRLVQTIAVFIAAAFYYQKLGLRLAPVLLGLMILTWGMSHALYESDLSFDTYFDVFFYLLAGLSILSEKYVWIIPITLIAAFNRETCGLIPFLLLAVNLRHWPKIEIHRQASLVALVALFIYGVVFVGLRCVIGPRPLFIPHGNRPGLELLGHNVGRFVTWFELFGTLGVVPFIALAYLKQWPQTLKLFLWIVVPIWLFIHLFASVMAETRLFLVPQALIFIPGALISLSPTKTVGPVV